MMQKSIKVISLNIERDKHLDLLIPFFQKEKADVLLLQEVLEENLGFFQKKLGVNYVFVPLCKLNLPEGIKPAGIATFSKTKIIKSKISHYAGNPKLLPIVRDHGLRKMNRAFLTTWLSKGQQSFCLINNYFTWTPNGDPNTRQKTDIKKLLRLLSGIPEFVMGGDFNAPRGKKIFDTLAATYKDNIPKNITTTIDKNLHYAGNLQIVTDGLFSTNNYEVKDIRIINGVSDHCAIAGIIYKT